MGTIILIVLLGGLATILFWQRFHQFGALTLTAAGWLFVTTWISVSSGWTVIFWFAWVIALAAAVILRYRGGFAAVTTAFAVGLIACLTGIFSPANVATASQSVLPVQVGSQTITPALVDNTSQSGISSESPAAGEATITENIPVSLACPETLSSLGDLVACVDKQPSDKKQAYITYFDAHKGALGASWQDVVNLAKLEKETRVIVVANSNVSEQKARELARPVAGAAASTLPVVYVDGAILNTRGGVGQEQLETYADNRSQVRVLLTTSADPQRNVAMAKAGRGVLTECTNVATGIVPKPKPIRVPKPEKPRPPQPTPSTPTSATPTPTPTTPTPTSTPPPAVCPWNPELPPNHPNCLNPKNPTDGPEPPPEHTLAPSPSGSPESSPPKETNPAKPTETPGAPAPTISAPSASPTASERPTHTQDPSPSQTATGDVDPDGKTSSTPQEDSSPSATPETTSEQSSQEAPSPESSAESTPPSSTETLNTTMGFLGIPLLGLGMATKRRLRRRH